jgi:hypothetical protein
MPSSGMCCRVALSSETSVLTRVKRRLFPEDHFIHSHRYESLKPDISILGLGTLGPGPLAIIWRLTTVTQIVRLSSSVSVLLRPSSGKGSSEFSQKRSCLLVPSITTAGAAKNQQLWHKGVFLHCSNELSTCETVPQLRLFGPGFPPRRSAFDPGSSHVVYRAALR